MSFKVWLKSKAADRVLSPLRTELIALVEQGASLLDIGCGTGDLLFRSAEKISRGYGIDIDKAMIGFANSKRQENNLDHLQFDCVDALELDAQKFDFSTSTLCLHELPQQKACELLRVMLDSSDKALISDYRAANSPFAQMRIELDELMSGHYGNYRKYRSAGEIPAYAEQIGARVEQEIQSSIDGISIWVVSRDRRV
ncbi:MAG: methyltransferase domain-containing protein [Porticoccaceae bacterium]|jgi:ubiquinone/menaquinone biosynthesis C-methylase UbiE|nr:methyltransferase domain-containing protein [Porticoccaceae bacterium]